MTNDPHVTRDTWSMPVSIRFNPDHAAIQRMLTSPNGPVGREVRRVTERVAGKAKATAPVDRGRLKTSVRTAYRTTNRHVEGVVYSDLDYSRWVQRGVGIYGPAQRPIRPRRASVLVFQIGGKTVYARSVRGTPANKFMVKALRTESPWPVTEIN